MLEIKIPHFNRMKWDLNYNRRILLVIVSLIVRRIFVVIGMGQEYMSVYIYIITVSKGLTIK